MLAVRVDQRRHRRRGTARHACRSRRCWCCRPCPSAKVMPSFCASSAYFSNASQVQPSCAAVCSGFAGYIACTSRPCFLEPADPPAGRLGLRAGAGRHRDPVAFFFARYCAVASTAPYLSVRSLHHVVDGRQRLALVVHLPVLERVDVVTGLRLRLGRAGHQQLVAVAGDEVGGHLDLVLVGPGVHLLLHDRRCPPAPSGPRSRSPACRPRLRCGYEPAVMLRRPLPASAHCAARPCSTWSCHRSPFAGRRHVAAPIGFSAVQHCAWRTLAMRRRRSPQGRNGFSRHHRRSCDSSCPLAARPALWVRSTRAGIPGRTAANA